MRYLKKYESHEDIHAICQEYGIKNYTINADESINVDEYINLSNERLTKLPLKFGNVSGSFWCDNNQLTSLEGCPISVGDGFYCYSNKLTSLEGCPKSVGGNFFCSPLLSSATLYIAKTNLRRNNSIDTFEGLDFIHIGGDFYCDGNPIYSIWVLFMDHTKFEFFNDCDPIRENRVIILDRLNFFLDYIGKDTVTEVKGYKCI